MRARLSTELGLFAVAAAAVAPLVGVCAALSLFLA